MSGKKTRIVRENWDDSTTVEQLGSHEPSSTTKSMVDNLTQNGPTKGEDLTPPIQPGVPLETLVRPKGSVEPKE